MWSAAVNLSKLCIGTGILALPYATCKGGTIGGPLGIALIAAWNGISCRYMIESKASCMHHQVPAGLSSTYSRIAYVSGGWNAVYLTDASIIITLVGVCVTYQITFSKLMEDFLQAFGISFISSSVLTVVSFLVLIIPVLVNEDISQLTKYSVAGLSALLVGVCSIVVYGIAYHGQDALYGTPSTHHLPLFPESMNDFATFVGISTFGFGICSLVFPIEECMAIKKEFPEAVLLCLIFVWAVYSIMGVGTAVLFIHDPHGISSNIMENLPDSSPISQLVRLAMAGVCLLTFPLAFIPPALMLENYSLQTLSRLGLTSIPYMTYVAVPHRVPSGHFTGTINAEQLENAVCYRFDGGNMATQLQQEDPAEPTLSLPMRNLNRTALLSLCTYFSYCFPCFGMVVSLLGCFTVSILSFVLPPFFRLKVVSLPRFELIEGQVSFFDSRVNQLLADVLMTLSGSVLCIVATSIVARQMMNNHEC